MTKPRTRTGAVSGAKRAGQQDSQDKQQTDAFEPQDAVRSLNQLPDAAYGFLLPGIRKIVQEELSGITNQAQVSAPYPAPGMLTPSLPTAAVEPLKEFLNFMHERGQHISKMREVRLKIDADLSTCDPGTDRYYQLMMDLRSATDEYVHASENYRKVLMGYGK